MSAAARRQLVERARMARDHGLGRRRSARLAGAPTPAPVPLAELKRWPGWPALDPDAQASIFKLVAVVAARDALDQIIEGRTLRALASQIGEAALDAILALPPGGDRALPAPGRLMDQGRSLAHDALPDPLRPPGTGNVDPQAARFVAMAEAVREAMP